MSCSADKSAWLGALFELPGPVSVLLAGVVSDKLFGSRRNPISVVCLLAAGGLLYFLAVSVVDHWLFTGGLGFGGRLAVRDRRAGRERTRRVDGA